MTIKKICFILIILIFCLTGCKNQIHSEEKSTLLTFPEITCTSTTVTEIYTYTQIETATERNDNDIIETEETVPSTVIEITENDLEESNQVEPNVLTDTTEIITKSVIEMEEIITSENTDIIDYYELDNNMDFSWFDDAIFLGDSICSGLKLYDGLLDVNQVIARGNVGTWNIDNYTFQYENSTNELDYLTIIEKYKPKKLFIFMGMNDLYMISAEDRNINIESIKNSILNISEDIDIYVLSLTPISESHKWAANGGKVRIKEYNESIEQYCNNSDSINYIDIYTVLSNDDNLIERFDGGDGLHLSYSAYIRILNQIINQLS